MNAGGLHIRAMTEADIPLGMHLKNQAGWNQTEADWRRFLSISPEGCFVGEFEGRGIATTLVFQFGAVAWIAMMLVDQSARRRGIGAKMMARALQYRGRRETEAVRLDATPMGKGLYEKLGFEIQYELTRFEGTARGQKKIPEIAVVPAAGPVEMGGLDSAMPSTDRSALLEAFWRENPEAIRVVRGEGYSVMRAGSRATQIGPVIASSESAGLALLDHALKQCDGQRIYIDIPSGNPPAMKWAEGAGLNPHRTLLRMQRGETAPDDQGRIFASSGPEKG